MNNPDTNALELVEFFDNAIFGLSTMRVDIALELVEFFDNAIFPLLVYDDQG